MLSCYVTAKFQLRYWNTCKKTYLSCQSKQMKTRESAKSLGKMKFQSNEHGMVDS